MIEGVAVVVKEGRTHTAVVAHEGGVRLHRQLTSEDGPFEVSKHVFEAFGGNTLLRTNRVPTFSTIPPKDSPIMAARGPIAKVEGGLPGYDGLTSEDLEHGEAVVDKAIKQMVDAGELDGRTVTSGKTEAGQVKTTAPAAPAAPAKAATAK